MSPTSYQTAPSRGKSASIPGFQALSEVSSVFFFGTLDQLDIRHGRVVAHAEAHLQDARVAARAGLEARAQFVEQLGHAVAVAQTVEGQAAVRHRVFLGQGDHGLDHAAQFLGLRQRGLDGLVLDERVHHVLQHRQAVRCRAVQFTESVSVAHGAFLFQSIKTGSRVRYCPQHSPMGTKNNQRLSRPAGGQFSSFMPRVRPREASTSLISLSDLRPRLGVFSSSFSVRWIRSPM